MLTDTARDPTGARKFVVRAVAASLALFGVLRVTWTEAHVVLPVTRVQGDLAVALFGAPTLPVEVTLACSGADALALCLGAVLAYPVKWPARLAGAAAGAALVLGLNTIRIGTLGQAAASPAWFNALHLYVWPAVLTLAIAAYVFAWMHLVDRPLAAPHDDSAPPRQAMPAARPQPSRRFVVLAFAFLLAFVIASPLYLESPMVLWLGSFVAGAAAVILSGFGATAHAAANVLWTPRGGFLVTQECVSTPLIPIYLAAVCAYAATWRRLIAGVAATVPLFIALGIVRLLVVALPDTIASPTFLVHAFYQLLLAAVVVFAAAVWRHGRMAAPGRAIAGATAGVLFVLLLGPFYTRVITYHAGMPLDDPQGAVALLPSFQTGLYLALWVAAFVAVGWRRVLAGVAVLALTQTAGLLALQALAGSGLVAHVRDVRGWAVAAPVLIFAAVIHLARPRR